MSILQSPLDRKKVDRLFHAVILLGLVISLLALVVYSIPGFYSRYLADDYCFSERIKNEGILRGLSSFYQKISNRYGAFLFISLTEWAGEKAIQFLPALMVVFLFFSFSYFIKKLLVLIDLTQLKIIPFLLSAFFVFLVLFQAPNLFQSLYWRSGMASYFAPLPFFYLILGLILRQIPYANTAQTHSWLFTALAFLLAFFSGGMSETYAAFQSVSLILYIILYILLGDRRVSLNSFLLVNAGALLGSLAAMAVMVLAPGNELRLNALPQAGNLWIVLQLSFLYALDFIVETLRGLPIPTVFTVLASIILGYHLSHGKLHLIQSNRLVWLVLIIPLAALIFIASICAPTVYGMLAYPEPRALIIARQTLSFALLLWGGVLGILSHRYMDRIINVCFASILLLGVLWFYPLRAVNQVWQQIPAAQNRAMAWDERQVEIEKQKADGLRVVSVNALDSVSGVAELSPDPQFWVNRCAAGFYGVESIMALNNTP